MNQFTTISLNKETKEGLDKLKLCDDESYDSMFKRIIKKDKENKK